MTKFKDFLVSHDHQRSIQFPSVSLKGNQREIFLRFTSKDELVEASYTGPQSFWLEAILSLAEKKKLSDLSKLNWAMVENEFKDDQSFWDHRSEEDELIFWPFELLHAALDVYRGREYLYEEESPLVCRCFGIREKDILEHLKTEPHPTLETLTGQTRAGMGCRTCLPQLKRWVVLHENRNPGHYYKEKPMADWLLEIDYMLSCFPTALEWKMEIQSVKGQRVIISYDKEVSQKEEESTNKELQDFLAASVDDGFAFFLRRARHFSKARG